MVNQTILLTIFNVIFTSTNGLDEKTNSIQEAKNAKLLLRTKLALEDAVKVLEEIQPDWLAD